MPKVYQRAAARRDLVEHFVYLAESASLDTAERFLANAEASFNDLTGQPKMGAPLTLIEQAFPPSVCPNDVDPGRAGSSYRCQPENTMRFLIIVRATADSEAGVMPDDDSLMAAMAAYHQQLAEAGALLDANGLKPSREGWRVQYRGGQPAAVLDGPFAETKELIAGYTLIQARSRDEALEWSRRFPSPFAEKDCEIEVRPLYELDDFAQYESTETFRKLEAARA